ncbi:hypothetical protein CIK05_10525 [Bdellovibrio sp. qaytius]|nr:hypothetical protein CIK05_10525 [Bdellovibrio sp. qaytius]
MKLENLDLYALKYFFDTVESQSLTKASEINFVTRSAISQSILRLEDWAGKKLTTHEKKNFRLTTEGESFYRQMKGSYESFKKAVATPLANAQSLKVGCSASTAEALVLPALQKIMPLKNLHLVTGTTAQLNQRLVDGDINIAIYIGDKNPNDKNEFVIESGSFILASKTGRLTSQIITTEIRPEVAKLHRVLLKHKIEMTSVFTVESWSLVTRLALELGHTCLIPDFLLSTKLKKVSLKGFSHPYQAIVRFRSLEKLTESEAQLVKQLHR